MPVSTRKVQLVCVGPSAQALAEKIPVLSPELLAAVAARYSRNGEGLDAILELVDPNDPDRSVDSIFRMVDYGHQSIADMAPVAIFMDGLSIWLIYHLWEFCARAGGQETSTRYVRFDQAGLVDFAETGMPATMRSAWIDFIDTAAQCYNEASVYWNKVALAEPERMRVPETLIAAARANPDSREARQLARLQRNFVFDRARYWIPAAALTNVMMVMPARDWVGLAQDLLSHPLPEAAAVGQEICGRLALIVPHLLRHAVATPDRVHGHAQDLRDDAFISKQYPAPQEIVWPRVSVSVDIHRLVASGSPVEEAFSAHPHRYSWIGREARRIGVKYGIDGVALGELRDLNRHRTGYKFAPMVPLGFYAASDQCDFATMDLEHLRAFDRWREFGISAARQQLEMLRDGNPWHVYWMLLGTQVPFEHGTTLDKMAYEIELRTGLGAHYRYADHMRAVHDGLVAAYPGVDGLIHLGQAEPE